jgi:hypothetical protein
LPDTDSVVVIVEAVDWAWEDTEARFVVGGKSKEMIGIDNVLSFDGSCPREGLWLDRTVVASPAMKDDEMDKRVVTGWVWPELGLIVSGDDEVSLARDNAGTCAEETPVADDSAWVELSGGQDSMPRHLREAVTFTGFCKELEETTEGDRIVERLWEDEPGRAEPRTTVGDLVVE